MILHVGMPKTGSSSLQSALAHHLRDPRFRFIQLGGMANGSLIMGNAFAELDDYPHPPTASRDERLLSRRYAMATLTSALNEDLATRPILSAEILHALLRETKLHMLDLFAHYHGDLQIAAYLRKPKSYVESAFQEVLKHRFYDLDHIDVPTTYQEFFEPFDDALGRQNVSIRLFERRALHEGCVVADFAQTWGIDIDRTDIARERVSLSGEAVKLLYIYRKKHPFFDPSDRAVLEFLEEVPGPKMCLHSSVFRRMGKLNPGDIDWASERVGADMAEDWTAHDEGAIREEADLLSPERETVDFLARRLDRRASSLSCDTDCIASALAALQDESGPNQLGELTRSNQQVVRDVAPTDGKKNSQGAGRRGLIKRSVDLLHGRR